MTGKPTKHCFSSSGPELDLGISFEWTTNLICPEAHSLFQPNAVSMAAQRKFTHHLVGLNEFSHSKTYDIDPTLNLLEIALALSTHSKIRSTRGLGYGNSSRIAFNRAIVEPSFHKIRLKTDDLQDNITTPDPLVNKTKPWNLAMQQSSCTIKPSTKVPHPYKKFATFNETKFIHIWLHDTLSRRFGSSYISIL